MPVLAAVAMAAMTFGDDVTVQKLDEGLLRFLRTRNQAQYTIRTPRGVDEGRYIPVGGIEQWITIRGEDRSNPVLLFLHGGPGDVTNPWSFTVFAPWLRHFTVVQWDQRGAGRTLRKSGSGDAGTMTLDRMTQDGIAVAEYLKGYLGKPKILLVAHSFGSILGLRMVSARPDLFSAYVGTGQVGDNTRNYAVAFEVLLEKARKSGEVQAVAELQRVGPPPYATGEGFQIQRKWANRFEGADTFLNGTIGLTLVAPGGSVQDLQDSANGQILSAERLVRQTNVLTSADLGLQFRVPVYFVQGEEDFTTPARLAREYLSRIRAPRKAFVTIRGGGHFAVYMKSREFLDQIVRLTER
jgi:pimeloyl-ACP methyl ester carboxylesterase